jgi:hypothetical protein
MVPRAKGRRVSTLAVEKVGGDEARDDDCEEDCDEYPPSDVESLSEAVGVVSANEKSTVLKSAAYTDARLGEDAVLTP